MEAVISCRDVAVGYPGRIVLSHIDFDLAPGSMTVLVGANGTGKSTLLRTLAGQQPPLKGMVTMCGRDITAYNGRELAKHRAIVDTRHSGGGGLTVGEAVAVGRYAFTGWTGLLSEGDRRAVRDALESVGMSAYEPRYLATLSDGERQKVMIARALAQDSPLLILDEPTSFLDVAARLEIMRMLRRFADAGKTVLLSTHDIAPALAQADMLMAVDPAKSTATLGKKEQLITDGTLDAVFARAGLHFDPAILDFR